MEEFNRVVPIVATTGTFNLTDEYLRMLGEDPYRYEKAKFLSTTFEMRLKLAAQSQVHDLRRSLHDLPTRLERLWVDSSNPPGARRLIICSLYRELGDQKSLEASRVINHFVRMRLPQDGPDSYTPAELAACNAGGDGAKEFQPVRRAAHPHEAPDAYGHAEAAVIGLTWTRVRVPGRESLTLLAPATPTRAPEERAHQADEPQGEGRILIGAADGAAGPSRWQAEVRAPQRQRSHPDRRHRHPTRPRGPTRRCPKHRSRHLHPLRRFQLTRRCLQYQAGVNPGLWHRRARHHRRVGVRRPRSRRQP